MAVEWKDRTSAEIVRALRDVAGVQMKGRTSKPELITLVTFWLGKDADNPVLRTPDPSPEPEVTHLASPADTSNASAEVERWRSGEDLVERQEKLPDGDSWQRMAAMATALAKSPLMPRHITESRDPEANLMVILLAAHDLGLSATVALQKVNVIEGKPAMAAELMRMLVRRDGHELWCEVERDDEGRARAVTWFGQRKDAPDRTHEARFGIEDAVDAGLAKLDANGQITARSSQGKRLPWEAYTEDMLSARATSRLCRRAFEDCLAGVSYTPEELGTITVEQDPPEAPEASQEVRDQIAARIAGLSPEAQATVKQRWKDARYRPLASSKGLQLLDVAAVPLVHALIDEVERDTPTEAEIIHEQADAEDVCEECLVPEGQPHDIGCSLRPM